MLLCRTNGGFFLKKKKKSMTPTHRRFALCDPVTAGFVRRSHLSVEARRADGVIYRFSRARAPSVQEGFLSFVTPFQQVKWNSPQRSASVLFRNGASFTPLFFSLFLPSFIPQLPGSFAPECELRRLLDERCTERKTFW